MKSLVTVTIASTFVALSLACSSPSEAVEGTADSALGATAPLVSVNLRNVGVAQYDLEIEGVFDTCVSYEPEVSSVQLIHPRSFASGKLAIDIGDRAHSCHAIRAVAGSFRVRLDASTTLAADPSRVHQLTPRIDSDYDVVINGANLARLSVGRPDLMSLARAHESLPTPPLP